MKGRCICGCGRRHGIQFHHVIYQQELRKYRDRTDVIGQQALKSDRRNLVPVGPKCHAAHHNRSQVLPMHKLPNAAFEFAVELMGCGPAYEYLRRRYAGSDPRHDALLDLA